jgi:hypothetical protein
MARYVPNAARWSRQAARLYALLAVRAPGFENPCSMARDSLFLSLGNAGARTADSAAAALFGFISEPSFRRFPCNFPVDQGIWLRDGFAFACTHRHPVRGCGDCPPGSAPQPRNSRQFAGFWARGLGDSEPETAGRAALPGNCGRSSLRAILAVRFGA